MSAIVVLMVLLATCVEADPPRVGTEASTTSTETANETTVSASSPSATASLAEPVILPELPRQGVAVDRRRDVVFVDLEGNVVARLQGFQLAYTWTVPGPVILREGAHSFFVLRPRAHVLVAVGDRDAAARVSPQFQAGFEPDADPGLPYPGGSRVEGHPEMRSGWWVYALTSPDGSRLLAQWSGECEVPNAFFIEGDSVLTVDGFRRILPAADSWGLGWTSDGRAVALVSGGPCSSSFARPGVYLFDGPGQGEFLIRATSAARMWARVAAPGGYDGAKR